MKVHPKNARKKHRRRSHAMSYMYVPHNMQQYATVFFFFFYLNNVDKASKTSQTWPPQLVVLLGLLHISRSHTEQRLNQHTLTENKSCCHCVARNASLHPTSRPCPTTDSIFTGVDAWCVNKTHWARADRNLWVRVQATNMCFQSEPTQLTQELPCLRIRAIFPSQTGLEVLVFAVTVLVFGWVSIFTVYLLFECLITANAQRKV